MFYTLKAAKPKGAISFKKFSRKRYAIFNSLKKTIHIAGLSSAYTMLALPVMAKTNADSAIVYQRIEIDEVVVFSENVAPELIPAAIGTSTQEELRQSPHQHIQDYLKNFGNLDVRQRGQNGIQTDLSYRGGTFDQTQVLLNGIPITDPQTGHLSLTLPVDKESLSKITFYNSASARLLQTNSLAGAVNFQTLSDTSSTKHVSVSYGSNKTMRLQGNMGIQSGILHQHASISYFQSDGYTENTDGNASNIFYNGTLNLPQGKLELLGAYQQKAFGANSFYTPKYPDQYEQNDILLLGVSGEFGKKRKICPQIYWRRHKDRFELFREHPDWYQNFHRSDVYGGKLQTLFKSNMGTSSVAIDLRSENIRSNNLGFATTDSVKVTGYNAYYTKKYSRNNLALHLTHEFTWMNHRLRFIPNVIFNWNDRYNGKIDILPSAILQMKASKNIGFNLSYTYSMAQPTFTDLFYTDPSNKGNINLIPYYMHITDGYINLTLGKQTVIIGAFQKMGRDVIDWVWHEGQNTFRPINMNRYMARGIETAYKLQVNWLGSKYVSNIEAHYTYLSMDKEIRDSVSKYNHLRQKFTLSVQQKLGTRLHLAANIIAQDRAGDYIRYNFDSQTYYPVSFKPYYLADARLTYTYRFGGFYLETTNLFNTTYVELGSIEQPGRLFMFGATVDL